MVARNVFIWAKRFNQCYGKNHLPATIFMTDKARVPDTEGVIRRLPRKSMVIIRDYDLPDRKGYARRITALSRRFGHRVLIANDIALAVMCKADGVHFPEWNLSGALRCKSIYPHFKVSVAAHSVHTLLKIRHIPVDYCLLSPVFETLSHPGGKTIGMAQFRVLQRCANIPVYPLGGITNANISILKSSVNPGIAGVGIYEK